MAVKCLHRDEQGYLVHKFVHENWSINGLVYYFGVSRRTIIRVLEDHGVDPKIRRRLGRKEKDLIIVQPVLELAQAECAIDRGEPAQPQERSTEPWYRRLETAVRRVFSRVST